MKIKTYDGYYLVLITSGNGQYVAMSLYRKSQTQNPSIQPNHKKAPGMVEVNENKVLSAPRPEQQSRTRNDSADG